MYTGLELKSLNNRNLSKKSLNNRKQPSQPNRKTEKKFLMPLGSQVLKRGGKKESKFSKVNNEKLTTDEGGKGHRW